MHQKMFEIRLCFVFLQIFIGFVCSSDQNIISVRLKNGLINGKIEHSLDGKQLDVFKGIPFAQPPVDGLRFKKPLPVKEWSEPIDAFKFSNACVQDIQFLQMIGMGDIRMSEDCLYLNIWSPSNTQNNDILKPVMFWIHGGGLSVGTASDGKGTNGEVLASKGDVVVVTINYRLNAFGFLYSGTNDAPGNVGLWDQALALEWVNDNIKYFGGDPDEITIFGESAGSWSVGLHVLSPVSRNLFKNAIMNSGAYLFNFVKDSPQQNINHWLLEAQKIGCEDDQAQNKFTQKIIDCLRKVEIEKLAQIDRFPELKIGSPNQFTWVTVDGVFLPHKPIEMLRTNDYNKNINLMISTTSDEGSSFLTFLVDHVKYNSFTPQNLTFSQAFDELKQLSEGLPSDVTVNGRDVSKLYFTGLSDSNDFDLLRRTIGIAIGDYLLLCPTILFAKEFYKNSDFKSNVYQYYYNSKSELQTFFCGKWMGVCHGSDLLSIFGLPLIDSNNKFNERDRDVAQQVVHILTQFAKNGVGPTQNGSEWSPFYKIDDNIIGPYYEITTKPKTDTNFGVGLKINECEYLWKKYLL